MKADSTAYEKEHGKPRGTGTWTFYYVLNDIRHVVSTKGTYTEASKIAIDFTLKHIYLELGRRRDIPLHLFSFESFVEEPREQP